MTKSAFANIFRISGYRGTRDIGGRDIGGHSTDFVFALSLVGRTESVLSPKGRAHGIAESPDGVQRFPLIVLEGQSGHHATANSRIRGLATRLDAFCN